VRALGIQNRRPWLGGHYSAASATAAAYAAACSLQSAAAAAAGADERHKGQQAEHRQSFCNVRPVIIANFAARAVAHTGLVAHCVSCVLLAVILSRRFLSATS